MFFSVIIPVYESEEYIQRAMESVCAQTFGDYELIVVDNGSTDLSFEIISDFISNHPQMNAHCIRLEQNQGISGGRNAGMNEAKGMYISLLDADDYWYPNKLEKVAETIIKYPEYDIIWHWENQVNGNSVKTSRFREVNNDDAFKDLLINGNCLSPTTVTVKTSLLKSVGGFDIELNKGQADYDCWLRLAKVGAKFHLIKDALSVWVVRESSLSSKHEQHYMAVIDMVKGHFDGLKKMGFKEGVIKKLWRKREAELYCYLGRSLSLMGETKKAREYYTKSIKIYPLTYKSYAGIIMSALHI